MPQIGFKCPDNVNVTHEECMSGCRIANMFNIKRCLPLPYLAACIPDRRPGNILSVTTLQKPTIQVVLECCHDYFVNPIARWNLIRGTMSHYLLEAARNKIPKNKLDLHVFEQRFKNDIFSGQIDFYNGEDEMLFDYKFVNGMKAFKMRSNVMKNAEDYVKQVNCYRMLLVENGYRVKKCFIVALAYNVQYTGKNKTPIISVVEVPELDEVALKKEMAERASEIIYYRDIYPLDLPAGCEETYDGAKCQYYCEVSEFCKYKQDIKEKKVKNSPDEFSKLGQGDDM